MEVARTSSPVRKTTQDDVAVDSSGVYWANDGSTSGTGTIVMRSLAGGPPTVLASGQAEPDSIATDTNAVYWANGNGAMIMKIAKP
jgi:hypothetical protein